MTGIVIIDIPEVKGKFLKCVIIMCERSVFIIHKVFSFLLIGICLDFNISLFFINKERET